MAASRPQPQADDISATTWADPALHQLGLWLMRQGVDAVHAGAVQDSVWTWYSFFVLPAYQQPVPLGIAAKPASRPAICFRLPAPALAELADDADQQRFEPVTEAFRFRVAERHAEVVDAQLDVLSPRSLKQFDLHMRRWCRSYDLEYLGVYHDDLRQELAVLMKPGTLKAWLATPNLALAGAKPGDLLDSDDDRPLRDLILSVRHALPLWT